MQISDSVITRVIAAFDQVQRIVRWSVICSAMLGLLSSRLSAQILDAGRKVPPTPTPEYLPPSVPKPREIDFKATIDLIKQRALIPTTGGKSPVFILSSRAISETTFENGRSVQKSVPLCYIHDVDAPVSLKIILGIAKEPDPKGLVARVYRSNMNRSGALPVVEIAGDDIAAAQFPVKSGDLVVFSKKEEINPD